MGSITIGGEKAFDVVTEPNASIQADKNSEYKALYFGNADVSNLTYTKSGKNLIIKNDKFNVTLLNYFTSKTSTATASAIKKLVSNNKTVYIADMGFQPETAAFKIKNGKVVGTSGNDVIEMSNYNNSKNKGLTIDGKAGNDEITGTQYSDTLIGGAGINTLHFDFNKTFGHDTVKLTANEQLILDITYGSEKLNLEDGYLKHTKRNNDLVLRYCDATSNEIILKDYFKGNSASATAKVYIGDDELGEYINENEYLNVEGKGKIYGTNFRDNITGSEKNDTIYAYAGDDTIATKGGKDTVVLTGVYGHDTIDSTGSSKVTVKLSSFDTTHIELEGNDFVYTTDDNSDFTYKNFLSGTSADLWISAGKKSYHVVNETGSSVDYSKQKTNNIIFLNGEETQTFTGSKKGSSIVSSDDGATFNYNGANDTYISSSDSDDIYNAKLTKSTHLIIADKGGDDDKLNLNNASKDLVLFYNTDEYGNNDDDLVIYHQKAVSYSNLAKSVKNNSYSGIKVENYFADGEIETVNNANGAMDISGWKYLLDIYIKDWFTSSSRTSVEDVFLNGTKKEKQALTNIFKSTTYAVYEQILEKSSKYSDISLINNNGVLEIYGKDEKGADKLLYPPISNFLGKETEDKLTLIVLDDEGKLMTMSIDSNMNVIYDVSNNNSIELNTLEKCSDISTDSYDGLFIINGKNNVLYRISGLSSDQQITLNTVDDNGNAMSMTIAPDFVEYNLREGNVVTFDSSEKYSDAVFTKTGSVLTISGKNDVLYTINGFDYNQQVTLNVSDDNKKSMSITVTPTAIEYNLSEDNVVTFNTDEKYSDVVFSTDDGVLTITGKDDALLYTVNGFTTNEQITLNTVDDNGSAMSMTVTPTSTMYNLSEDNVITFDTVEKYSDVAFSTADGVLTISGKEGALYTINGFTTNEQITLNTVDDNGSAMSMTVTPTSTMYNLSENNVITFDTVEKYSDVAFSTDDGVLTISGKEGALYTINGFTTNEQITLNTVDDNGSAMSMTVTPTSTEYNMGNDNVISLITTENYADISYINDNGVLKIYGKDDNLLYTVNDFVSETDSQLIKLIVKDDSEVGQDMSININSLLEKTYDMGNNNTMTFSSDNMWNPLTTSNGSSDTLIFTDKDYADFYTKGELSGDYAAGDPLIQKVGNDLVIDDITVKNIDGFENEIHLVDKEGLTKTIIIGSGEINGTFESEIIIGSNGVDTINSNGNNDLIYLGEGNDTLNMTQEEKGDATGNNTAEMVGIGGTHPISNDLDFPAISVYSESGDDTYNTTLKDFGFYVEDFAGNDTINITYTDDNLMFFFDVINPNHADEHPVFYEDLMICDKTQFTSTALSAITNASGTSLGFKSMMEDLQGSFGYVWIDDHFGGNQEIENINIVDAEGESTGLDIDEAIAATQAKVVAWLTSTSGFFKPSQDYATAWDVLEGDSKMDKIALMSLYMS